MNEKFEHEAVNMLAEFAEHWAEAPLLEELPSIRAAVDQFAAGTHENMHKIAEFTEGERIAFAFGYMMAATRLHEQIEHSGMHEDEEVSSVCEATGLFAGTVAAQALEP